MVHAVEKTTEELLDFPIENSEPQQDERGGVIEILATPF